MVFVCMSVCERACVNHIRMAECWAMPTDFGNPPFPEKDTNLKTWDLFGILLLQPQLIDPGVDQSWASRPPPWKYYTSNGEICKLDPQS